MNAYPEVVAKVLNDYLERLKLQLRNVPAQEQNEFIREIQSHIYEAYHREAAAEDAAGDELTRILRVLRNIGEPSEVVSDRLPEAMARRGSAWRGPLSVLGSVPIAVFGIPLGFGGVAMVIGGLAAITGIVVAYYALGAAALLTSVTFLAAGMTRLYQPELWDGLLSAGIIQMDPEVADFVNRLSPSAQGNLLILFAIVFAAASVTLLWSGRYLLRGHRFIVGLVFDGIRRLAKRIRTRLNGFSQSEPVTDTRPFAPT